MSLGRCGRQTQLVADLIVAVVDGADLTVERGLDRLACAFHFR